MSSLRDFLAPLGLESYIARFEEEEITDVALLRSMGPEMLLYSMQELSMPPEHIDLLAKALFLDGVPESGSSSGVTAAMAPAMAANDEDEDMVLLEANDADAEAQSNDTNGVVLEENDENGGEEEEQLQLEENGHIAEAPSSAPVAAISDATKKAAERVKAQGNAALKNGKFADAASFYGQAIALDPTSAVYRSNRAAAYASLCQYESALADAKEAARLEPGWAKAHLRVASALSGLSRHGEARDAYAAALRCEPGNGHIRAMVEAAEEAARLEAQLAATSFDWVEEINTRHPPHEHYVKGVEMEDDYPMVVTYKEALRRGLAEVAAEEGAPTLRTPGGAAMRVETILATTFEKLTCLATRAAPPAAAAAAAARSRGVVGELAVRLWHFKRDWREADAAAAAEGADGHAARMARRAAAEHERLAQLSGCIHWLQLVADVASEKEARIGGETYPAIYVEHFAGTDLADWLKVDVPPARVRRGLAADAGTTRAKRKPPRGGGAAESESDSLSASDEEGEEGEEEEEGPDGGGAEAMRLWREKVAAYSPAQLERELGLIQTVAVGVLRGLKEANAAGLRYEADGSEGPYLSDVALLDEAAAARAKGAARGGGGGGAAAAATIPPSSPQATSTPRVKFVETETLGEFQEGDDRRFTAEPFVYSPIGDYVRAWWEGTAAKIGVRPGELCKDEAYLTVLNRFGTLNWLLFKWQPEALQGDEILRLVVHGAEEPAPPPVDASLEAHWKDFSERAFVMLGPRRFEEIQEVSKGLQAGEISGADAVARSRYCMGREFELLHNEYLGLLKQFGYKLK